ncbi:hypothetical protein NL108_009851 [Boleophthalmus pectinirostris]|nr:hypothetical protein NL108_009851 [Boleophthalmus pectinirostris]
MNKIPLTCKMGLLNVRSLANKSFIINDMIVDEALDCMFLTETWTGTDGAVTLNETTPPNYSYSYSSRLNKKGGGTAIILSAKHNFKNIHFNQYPSFEHHSLALTNPSILLICIYRPPKHSSSFTADFSDLLSIAHSNYNRIIIVGDFNLHIDVKSDSLATDFLNLLNCMNFKQNVLQPTHNRGRILDLVISYGLSVDIASVVDVGFSDHACIFFNITFEQPPISECIVRKHCITAEVTTNFTEILDNTPTPFLPSSCDFTVEYFNNKLKSALDAVAPLKLKTVKTKKSPWKNEKTRQLKQNCRKAERKWRKNKITINYEIYREQVRKYNNGMKSERQAYLSQLINNNIKNPRILFSTISSVIDPVRNWKEPSNMPNCEDFVTYFSNKIQSIRAEMQQIQPSNICITSPLILSNTLDSFALVDATTLNKIILQLKPATCFLDPIPTSLFKSVFNFLAQEVLNIVNLSLQTGVFPTPVKNCYGQTSA